MTHLSDRLTRTDRLIRELTLRIELYRNRVARRSRNPALADQATQLLPATCKKLEELARYRRRLAHALEVDAYLSPQGRAAEYPLHERHLPPQHRA
jgi:hypothetical protein